MTRQLVALTGVSGVGKSTLIKTLAASVPLEHLQASALIMEGQQASDDDAPTQDQLRLGDIDENQQLLIRGFRIRVGGTTGLVILDSHTVIERDHGLIQIDTRVFREIGIDSMIFLYDDPESIARRRRDDTVRKRPVLTVEELRIIQEEAQGHTATICRMLGIPFHVFRPNQSALIAQTLQQRGGSRE